MTSHHLNILTFNLSFHSSADKITLHISTLNAEAPNTDLFCLQEITPSEFKTISAAFPYFQGFMSSGYAIFVRRSVFEVAEVHENVNAAMIHVLHNPSNKIIEIWSLQADYSLIENLLSSYPQIICGQITNLPKRPEKFIHLLRKVGDFEPTHPYKEEKPPTGILIQGLNPVSGDVLDMGLWKIKDEESRVQRLLELSGSDYFPVRASLRFPQ